MAGTKIQPEQIAQGGATNGQVLTWNNGSSIWEPDDAAGGISGSGTDNYLAKWASSSSLENSMAWETSNTFSIGTNTGIDSYTRLYIYGGGSGANVDARGTATASTDQATFDAQASDYSTTFKSVHLRYLGPSAVGTTLGYSNVYLGDLTWTEPSTAIIQVVANSTPIKFGINGTEVAQVSSTGLETRGGKTLRLNDSDNTHYIELKTPATGDLTTSYTLTLPQNDGSSGEFLQTDGSGVLTWAAASGYTDEQAQDAIGAMIDTTLVYTDGTPLLSRAALSGDITASAGSNTTTLATVNSNVGSFGSATQAGTFTVNAKGLITAASNTTIAIPSTAVTDFAEAVDDRVAALIQNGTGITWSYSDVGNTLTPTVTITQYTDELAQDAIGAMIDSSLNYVDGTPLLQRAALSGDVTASAGSNTTTIADNAVTLAKMADMATASFLGRNTAGTGDPEVLSIATAKTMLNLTGTNSGDQTITLTGDVTGSGTGSFAATIANDAVTFAKMQNIATASFIGRITAATGDPENLTATQATSLLDLFSTSATTKGLVPGSNGATTSFLKGDGTWATPAVDGNGIYTGSGTIASNVVATLTNSFTIDHVDGTNAFEVSSAAVTLRSDNASAIVSVDDIQAGITFNSKGIIVEELETDVTNNLRLQQGVIFGSAISPAQITANQNDYNPTSLATTTHLRLSTDASRDITGIVAQEGHRVLFIHNIGSFNIVLKDESVSSTAANRFALSKDITIAPDQSVMLVYDATTARWRSIDIPGSGSGLSDGDKGDITVSSSGTVWTIDANVVSNAKFRQSAGLSVVGRSANTTGDVADITGTDGQVLRVSGTTLGFGTIVNAGINDVSVAKLTSGILASGLTATLVNNSTFAFRYDGSNPALLVDDANNATSIFGQSGANAVTADNTGITLTGPVVATSTTALTGDINPTVSSNQNDWTPTSLSGASVIRVNCSSDSSITGLTGGSDGRMLVITNVGSAILTLVAESASSTAANRFDFAANVVLNPDESVLLIYDSTSSRWRFGSHYNQGTDVQLFTSNGTWTKPLGAKSVFVWLVGSGGGGGSGSRAASGVDRCGGGGGAGGSYAYGHFLASDLSATESVTVPAGGTGGTGQTSNSTNGNNGNAGSTSSFGTKLRAGGGAGGPGGQNSGATSRALGSLLGVAQGCTGGRGTSTTGEAGHVAAGNSLANVGGAGAGGSGGGIDVSNVAYAGGAGGESPLTAIAGGTAGAVNTAGGAGNAGTGSYLIGTGGGGGGSNTSNGRAGGVGGAPGGGGGGGSATPNGVTSGAGGNGGAGACLVITNF